jgi:hypothetical protein
MCLSEHNNDFRGLFQLSKNRIPTNKELVTFLISELKKTRLYYEDGSLLFTSYAMLYGIKESNVLTFWDVIKPHLDNFPFSIINYTEMEKQLSTLSKESGQISSTIIAVKTMIENSKKSLKSNFASLKQLDLDLKLGLFGELILFLYFREIINGTFFYHKLIPDNVKTPRHGLDLLVIKFGETEHDDMVYFCEAKGTLSSIYDQTAKIVKWFNQESKTYLTSAIEAARIEWTRSSAERGLIVRALAALAKYETYCTNYQFAGSIAHDKTVKINDNQLSKFSEINVSNNNKCFILFSIEKFQELMNKVSEDICTP